jgi:hypothetical protein
LAEKLLAESESDGHYIIDHLIIPLALIDRHTLVPVLTNKAMDNLLQAIAFPPHNAPFPFIDTSLKYLLTEHVGEESIHCTVTLPSAYGATKQLFIFQPLVYQDKRMFLAFLYQPTSLCRQNPDTPEQYLNTFH